MKEQDLSNDFFSPWLQLCLAYYRQDYYPSVLENLVNFCNSLTQQFLSGWCMFHLSALLNPHFSHNWQGNTLATLSCLILLYSFWASLGHCCNANHCFIHTHDRGDSSSYTSFLWLLLYCYILHLCSSTQYAFLSQHQDFVPLLSLVAFRNCPCNG